jgi:hypothetical protein
VVILEKYPCHRCCGDETFHKIKDMERAFFCAHFFVYFFVFPSKKDTEFSQAHRQTDRFFALTTAHSGYR